MDEKTELKAMLDRIQSLRKMAFDLGQDQIGGVAQTFADLLYVFISSNANPREIAIKQELLEKHLEVQQPSDNMRDNPERAVIYKMADSLDMAMKWFVTREVKTSLPSTSGTNLQLNMKTEKEHSATPSDRTSDSQSAPSDLFEAPPAPPMVHVKTEELPSTSSTASSSIASSPVPSTMQQSTSVQQVNHPTPVVAQKEVKSEPTDAPQPQPTMTQPSPIIRQVPPVASQPQAPSQSAIMPQVPAPTVAQKQIKIEDAPAAPQPPMPMASIFRLAVPVPVVAQKLSVPQPQPPMAPPAQTGPSVAQRQVPSATSQLRAPLQAPMAYSTMRQAPPAAIPLPYAPIQQLPTIRQSVPTAPVQKPAPSAQPPIQSAPVPSSGRSPVHAHPLMRQPPPPAPVTVQKVGEKEIKVEKQDPPVATLQPAPIFRQVPTRPVMTPVVTQPVAQNEVKTEPVDALMEAASTSSSSTPAPLAAAASSTNNGSPQASTSSSQDAPTVQPAASGPVETSAPLEDEEDLPVYGPGPVGYYKRTQPTPSTRGRRAGSLTKTSSIVTAFNAPRAGSMVGTSSGTTAPRAASVTPSGSAPVSQAPSVTTPAPVVTGTPSSSSSVPPASSTPQAPSTATVPPLRISRNVTASTTSYTVSTSAASGSGASSTASAIGAAASTTAAVPASTPGTPDAAAASSAHDESSAEQDSAASSDESSDDDFDLTPAIRAAMKIVDGEDAKERRAAAKAKKEKAKEKKKEEQEQRARSTRSSRAERRSGGGAEATLGTTESPSTTAVPSESAATEKDDIPNGYASSISLIQAAHTVGASAPATGTPPPEGASESSMARTRSTRQQSASVEGSKPNPKSVKAATASPARSKAPAVPTEDSVEPNENVSPLNIAQKEGEPKVEKKRGRKSALELLVEKDETSKFQETIPFLQEIHGSSENQAAPMESITEEADAPTSEENGEKAGDGEKKEGEGKEGEDAFVKDNGDWLEKSEKEKKQPEKGKATKRRRRGSVENKDEDDEEEKETGAGWAKRPRRNCVRKSIIDDFNMKDLDEDANISSSSSSEDSSGDSDSDGSNSGNDSGDENSGKSKKKKAEAEKRKRRMIAAGVLSKSLDKDKPKADEKADEKKKRASRGKSETTAKPAATTPKPAQTSAPAQTPKPVAATTPTVAAPTNTATPATAAFTTVAITSTNSNTAPSVPAAAGTAPKAPYVHTAPRRARGAVSPSKWNQEALMKYRAEMTAKNKAKQEQAARMAAAQAAAAAAAAAGGGAAAGAANTVAQVKAPAAAAKATNPGANNKKHGLEATHDCKYCKTAFAKKEDHEAHKKTCEKRKETLANQRKRGPQPKINEALSGTKKVKTEAADDITVDDDEVIEVPIPPKEFELVELE